jgi:hypothetical protein
MNRITWGIACVLCLSLGFNGWLYFKNDQTNEKFERLNHTVLIMNQKDQLQQQQMNEFIMVMYNRTNENIVEVGRAQGKIEGMIAVINNQKPNETESSAIWHSGYHRGLDQQKDMKGLEGTGDTIYTDDKKTPKK